MPQILVVLLTAAFITLAQPAKAVPYAKVVSLQSAFAALPVRQRDKLMLQVRIVHLNAADHSSIHAWVMDADKRLDVPLSADGSLPDVPNSGWIARGLQLQTDQPKGTVHTQVAVFIRPPGGLQISASYLLSGVQQAQAVLVAGARQIGGYMATFAVPTLHVVKFKLAGCCTGKATGLGVVPLSQDAGGYVVVPVKLLDAKRDAAMLFSAPVLEINPDTD